MKIGGERCMKVSDMKMNKKGVKGMNKSGQISIFVIVGVIIVALVILFFLITDTGRGVIDRATGAEIDVEDNFKSCIENKASIKEKINEISSQGGSKEPQLYYMYDGVKLEYLCYNNQYLSQCVMQKPFVYETMGKEIEEEIEEEIEDCVESLETTLERRGYEVSSGALVYEVSLEPNNLIIDIELPLTVTRENTNRYNDFSVRVPSKLYSLLMISSSILNFEARYGDSETTTYMALYPDIRVEKLKQGEGTTVYLVSNRDTKEEFNFATRSIVIPPGYTLKNI